MKKVLVVVSLGAALALSACGNDSAKGVRDKGPADAINFPDEVPTVFYKCNGPNMVYVTDRHNGSNGGAVSVVKDDPRCPGARGQK